jgi:hypothetical protein
MDTKDQVPSDLPMLKGGIPLFGKEKLGEIFGIICLFNYELLSNYLHRVHFYMIYERTVSNILS